MQVVPDWTLWAHSPEDLNREIGNGFEFKGPGFYLNEGEFSLIVPNGGVPNLFDFHQYGVAFCQSVFGTPDKVPVVVDARD